MPRTHRFDTLLERFKNPAYTGDNRCIPCTAINTFLAGVIALIAGVVARASSAGGVVAGLFVFGCALSVIYFRGYLVPGTPRLTKRYLPDWLLAIFDTADDPARGLYNPEVELRRIGAIEPDPRVDDLLLTPSFAQAWRESLSACTNTESDLRHGIADILLLSPDRLAVSSELSSFIATYDGDTIARWESQAACRADVAAAVVLAQRDPDWGRRSIDDRMELLATLRFFLERCPNCTGTVSLAHGVVESCCRTLDVAVVTCEDCDTRIAEVPIDLDAAESATVATTVSDWRK
ncbi:hypothetical protein G6M89_17305 [Natronolimnobius sp. AArcel1]|uniref:hypothetical protein n=1 Tax=Natronolimnobius sp. AArcel1 TaxID=1679093 RepID=UPI0013EE3D8C|nr:hypothetical protein [Natronolimnobius sp. AArcel1]NGM70742.1 hypothetical protein [Natronolimnobius sp. AArcel1]